MAEQAGKNKPLDLSSQSDQQGQPVAEVLAQKGQVRIGETTLGDKNLDSNEQAKQTSQAVKEALTVGETVELGKDSAVVARFREGGILVLGQDQTVEISRDLLKRIADARAQGDQAKIQKLEKHLQDLEPDEVLSLVLPAPATSELGDSKILPAKPAKELAEFEQISKLLEAEQDNIIVCALPANETTSAPMAPVRFLLLGEQVLPIAGPKYAAGDEISGQLNYTALKAQGLLTVAGQGLPLRTGQTLEVEAYYGTLSVQLAAENGLETLNYHYRLHDNNAIGADPIREVFAFGQGCVDEQLQHSLQITIGQDALTASEVSGALHANAVLGNALVLAEDNGPWRVVGARIGVTDIAKPSELEPVLLAECGSLEIKADGNYRYTPLPGLAEGDDIFTLSLQNSRGELAVNTLYFDRNSNNCGLEPLLLTEVSETDFIDLGQQREAPTQLLGFAFAGQEQVAGGTIAIAGVGRVSVSAEGRVDFESNREYEGNLPPVHYSLSDGANHIVGQLQLSEPRVPVEAELAPEQDWQFSFLPQQLAGALVASLVEPGWQGYHFVDTGEAACISADGCFAIDERGGVRLTRVGADADPQTLLARRYLIGAEDQAGGRHLAQLQFAPAATEPNLGLAYVDSDGGDLSLHTLLCPGKLVAAGVAYQAEQQLPHAYHTTAVGLDLPALDANVF